MQILTLKNVTYTYEGVKTPVLNGVDASFEAGKIYSIVGKSGSGKSTLLSLIAGLDVPTQGDILHYDKDLRTIDRDEYRAKHIGVVFQSFNLLINASAIENIVLSMHIGQSAESDKKAFAYDVLEQVGINAESAERKVLKLSGGEQQRVGIARAIAHNPDIVIADEPTGNLDTETEKDILDIFSSLARDKNKCVILVTHSEKVSKIADVVYRMRAGKILPETS